MGPGRRRAHSRPDRADLIQRLPDLSLILARRLAGLDVHYGKPGELTGSRVADTGDALLDGRPSELVVDNRRVIVRPDGYVGDPLGDQRRLRQAER